MAGRGRYLLHGRRHGNGWNVWQYRLPLWILIIIQRRFHLRQVGRICRCCRYRHRGRGFHLLMIYEGSRGGLGSDIAHGLLLILLWLGGSVLHLRLLLRLWMGLGLDRHLFDRLGKFASPDVRVNCLTFDADTPCTILIGAGCKAHGILRILWILRILHSRGGLG